MRPKRAIIPVFVPHLGCPNMCVFCNQRRISGTEIPADADTVRDAVMKGLDQLENGARPALAFYGGSFTAIPAAQQEELLGAAQPFLSSGDISSIRLSTRPDAIDDETVERLSRFGVKTVELGVQSMCDDVLLASKRGHTPQDAIHAAGLLKKAGFELILQMMTGLPCDTPEKSAYTARQFVKLRPDGVRIYPTVIVKDTELFDMWQAGEYSEHTVEEAVELCAGLMEIFDEAGIPVIRLGLNPTDKLSEGDAAGGAYHPALGELVMNRRYLKRETALLEPEDAGKEIAFAVAPGRLSAAIGQKRCNIRALTESCGLVRVKFYEDDSLSGMDIKRLS